MIKTQNENRKNLAAIGLSLFIGLFPLWCLAHGEIIADGVPVETVTSVLEEQNIRTGAAAALNVTPAPLSAGTNARLDFYMTEQPSGAPVLYSTLDVVQTKLMHAFGVRTDDLGGFFHIFPTPTSTPGHMVAEHTFDESGQYKVWSQFSSGGNTRIIGHPVFNVGPDVTPRQRNISIGRNVIVGNYQVTLAHVPDLVKNRMDELTLEIRTLTGNGAILQEYLGAPLHVVAIKGDLTVVRHFHVVPTEHMDTVGETGKKLIRQAFAHGSAGDTIPVVAYIAHVDFPSAGLYKLFVRFRPADAGLAPDQALTASFWVNVKDSVISKTAAWWILLSVSIVLIALLSFAVSKFIKPKSV
ncbi:MAG: hypothetical protein AAB539_01305 [Patescibacteria group bacterium]